MSGSQRSPSAAYKQLPRDEREEDVAEIKKALATGQTGHESSLASACAYTKLSVGVEDYWFLFPL